MIKETETQPLALSKQDGQIARFVDLNELPAGSPISVAVAAVEMTSNHSCLQVKRSDCAFVVYSQPLDGRFKCLPLYVIRGDSEQASAEIQTLISALCDCLAEHRFEPKDMCTDGDPGNNELHKTF
jgi:hypothetical protein